MARARAASPASCRSSTTDRFPRAIKGNDGRVRSGLPPGGSTWTTSAPKSASVWVAWAPAGLFERSSTRRPPRGPVVSVVSSAISCSPGEFRAPGEGDKE